MNNYESQIWLAVDHYNLHDLKWNFLTCSGMKVFEGTLGGLWTPILGYCIRFSTLGCLGRGWTDGCKKGPMGWATRLGKYNRGCWGQDCYSNTISDIILTTSLSPVYSVIEIMSFDLCNKPQQARASPSQPCDLVWVSPCIHWTYTITPIHELTSSYEQTKPSLQYCRHWLVTRVITIISRANVLLLASEANSVTDHSYGNLYHRVQCKIELSNLLFQYPRNFILKKKLEVYDCTSPNPKQTSKPPLRWFLRWRVPLHV